MSEEIFESEIRLEESEIEEYALKNGIIEKNDYVDFVAIHEDLEK